MWMDRWPASCCFGLLCPSCLDKLLAVPPARVLASSLPLPTAQAISLLGAAPPNPCLCLSNSFPYYCVNNKYI
ncbi:hypothetical protein F5888DRAFT_1754130 [Russula emetica]|nr:hypothetical protein F5888DRAFT_1754130 [Russula emetica]